DAGAVADRALVAHGQSRLAVLAADAHADAVGTGKAGGVHGHAGVGAAHRRELVDPAILFAEALVDVLAEGVELAVELCEHGVGVGVGRVQRLHRDGIGVVVGRGEGGRVAGVGVAVGRIQRAGGDGVELAAIDRVARRHAVGHVRDHGAAGAVQGDGCVGGVVVFDRKFAAGAGAGRAFGTLRTFRPGIALRALGAFRSSGARRPLGALRPGRDRVDAVLQFAQPRIDGGEGGADVVVAAALDDVAGGGEYAAAEAGTAAECRNEAAELAHGGCVVVTDAVGDVDQPPLQVAAVGVAVDLVLVRGQVAEGHGVGFRG